MRKAKQSTAKNVMVLMVQASDHITGLAGLTLTITASKDGAAFAGIAPTVTDRGTGWYNVELTTSHTDTLGDLALHVTGAAADPADLVLLVEAGSTDVDVSTRSTFAGGAVASVTGSVGSVTGLTAANLDVAVSTRLATAGYTAPDNASITSMNGRLPTDPADQSAVEAAITAYTPWTKVIEAGYTAAEILRIIAAHAAGAATGLEGANPQFTGIDGTTLRIDGAYTAGTRTIDALDGT